MVRLRLWTSMHIRQRRSIAHTIYKNLGVQLVLLTIILSSKIWTWYKSNIPFHIHRTFVQQRKSGTNRLHKTQNKYTCKTANMFAFSSIYWQRKNQEGRTVAWKFARCCSYFNTIIWESGFLQVTVNWKMSGNLYCQGKSGKCQGKYYFWKVRENYLGSCRLHITVIFCISKY